MSKNFFYDYREVLAEKLEKKYTKELVELSVTRKKQKQLDSAEVIITNYFNILKKDLGDTLVVANDVIEIITNDEMILKFTMYQNYIKFTRFDHAIEVEIGEFDPLTDIVEARINSNIIPSDKRCVVKKIGKVHDGSHFDENTINYYMNEAFGELKELDN